ncbi:putative transcription initiation factor [Ceratocystis platani]|uniref:Putative transcription initiation factor n=1 Tax=Ceratocystis fimbriata f. sp. platani TaxID=88771 RepID=A0A0F8BX10_CERFI|nr:putative transcription initiation factor [Ceratocystis platani]
MPSSDPSATTPQSQPPAPDDVDEEFWQKQDAADEDAIRNFLKGAEDPDNDLNAFLTNETIDQSGKADDAMDYGDISDDDDLPDEEIPTAAAAPTKTAGSLVDSSAEAPDLTDDSAPRNPNNDGTNDNDFDADDLFGERDSSPFGNLFGPETPEEPAEGNPAPEPTTAVDPAIVPESSFRDPPFQGTDTEDFDMLAADQTNQDPDIPPAIESAEELLKQKWPDFKQGVVLEWNSLLPPKPSKYIPKKPLRKMKPLITSKLSLDIAPDQEKIFRLPDNNRRKAYDPDNSHFVQLGLAKEARQATTDNEINLDNDEDDDPIGGFTLQDIATVCFDFSADIESAERLITATETDTMEICKTKQSAVGNDTDGEGDDEWDAIFKDVDNERPKKKPRVIDTRLPNIPRYTAPGFDDFENHTKRLGKRVYVDFTDPHLHLEEVSVEVLAKRQKIEASNKRIATGNLGRLTKSRFNIANDDAYEMLKENHKHKVRATLGNINVEHSLPALKLAWPYYKVKLEETPDRYHRPPLRTRQFVNRDIEFHRRGHIKKKLTKGKAHEVFRETKDLSLNDNSSAVLFEYCERVPTVLSKFGMANRVINYYRKIDATDEKMPEKLEVGETHVLLPEDRSPFSIFGTVNPGQIVPTFHNQMYRAPLFKHKVRTGDFLLGRSSTGLNGSKWYLRNIDHIFVVGQTFPSVEVPGPHSRKVTNASKNRIKMISYRLMHKDPSHLVNLSDITRHIADSTDAQNRQKLKEFLAYAKSEKGQWKLRDGEVLMDEERIRAMIKPEDTCLIDGMALGLKMLEDAGFDPKNAVLDDEESDDEDEGGHRAKGSKKNQEKAEEALADKMAPWKTSKAFIDACAGKAMLQLHGEGDPTGHGLGFSFIRTSMKGGYIEAVQGPLATSADAMERQKRENNGHAYNVKRQEAMYRDGISEIWEKQRSTLSDPQLHDDNDVLHTADEDDRFSGHPSAAAAAGHGQTPMAEDGFSQISGFTSASRAISKKKLRITRQVRQPDGSVGVVEEVVEDPVVIAHYLKRRDEADINPTNLYDILPTGNADRDRLGIKKVEEELARLKKNRERRKTREKQKELHRRVGSGGVMESFSPEPGTPASATGPSPSTLISGATLPGASTPGGVGATGSNGAAGAAATTVDIKSVTGTTRKCANCGQVGHIKTNKKLCPLLNGTIKNDGPQEIGGFGGFSAPTPSSVGGMGAGSPSM